MPTQVYLETGGKTEITNIKSNVVSAKNRIGDVQTKVNSVKTKIEGNISDVSDEFKEQVDLLRSKGELLKDTAEQLLDWLNAHKEEYLNFAGSNRCGGGSPCDEFRNELQTFAQDFSLLSDRFPIVEKLGLSDAPVITKLLDRLPPILLFPMYETMQRTPDWREMPSKLTSIYDEIGDPDAFSVRLSPLSDAISNIKTPTERLCDRMADRLDGGMDPVRLSRIKLYIAYLKTVYSITGEALPKDQNVELVGEGGSLPIPNILNKVNEADTAGLSVSKSRSSLNRADVFRNGGMWKEPI